MTHVSEQIRDQLAPHRIGILGFGLEGRSTLAFLREMFPDRTILVADRDAEGMAGLPGLPDLSGLSGSPGLSGLSGMPGDEAPGPVQVFSGADCARGLVGCSLIFKTPGIPWKNIDHLFRPEQMTSQTDLFLTVLGARTIGITGTKGKSTTAALVCAALRACGRDAVMVGNIGLPALNAVAADTPDRLYVYECSSHMLETVCHAPHAAVFLNLYEEHLDHYRSFGRYAAAKENILKLQVPGDFAIIGEQIFTQMSGIGGGTHRQLDITSDGALVLPPVTNDGEPVIIPETSFANRRLRGMHNLRYLQTALLMTRLYGAAVTPGQIHRAIASLNGFEGLPHRLQLIAVAEGISFFDDSISTIPQASIAAVISVGDVDTLIFGGLDRGIDYTPLSDFLLAGTVRNLVALPATGHRMIDLLLHTGNLPASVRTYKAKDMEEAVDIAFQTTRPGYSCLLSPAAASYGYYLNFEERGVHFAGLVRSRISKNVLP